MSHAFAVNREAFFLDTPRGSRFAVAAHPAGALSGGLLYLHPFAEELNKTRRMAALASNAFAQRGWLVLQLDFGGCGDSAGEFGDYDWQDWINDVSSGWAWLRDRCRAPSGLWTLRGGSLLAADWLARSSENPPLLLWQPVANGLQHLTQFLRSKAASEMLGATEAKGVVARLHAQLDDDQSVEVAGYSVSPRLAAGLKAARLRLPEGYAGRIAIIEVARDRTEVSPALARLLRQWLAASVAVTAQVADGPSFWQTLEIETSPALIAASLQALERLRE